MRYQKIHSQIWTDEKFMELSDDGRMLFFYVQTSPHSNGIGLYVLPKPYIECDLRWNEKRLAKPFMELLAKGLILYDELSRIICVKNHLKHNPIENENQAKSASKIISSLPKSSLYSTLLERLNKPFHKPLVEVLRERYAKPEEEEETETEEETEEEVPDRPSGPTPSKDWLQILREDQTYDHVNWDYEIGKMKAWLRKPKNKSRRFTESFVLNWVNKIDKPISGGNGDGSYEEQPPTDPTDRTIWEIKKRREKDVQHTKPAPKLD